MTTSVLIPEYSQEASASLDIFYLKFNDVNFYVEDADQENFYYLILKKFFSNIKINKIFPLGGKENLLTHLKDSSNSSIKKRVYLADKDFDDLLGTTENIDCLFYLPYYCIENHLLCIDSIIEVIIETHPKESKESITENLNLCGYLEKTYIEIRNLFKLFYVSQFFKLGLKNCSSKVEEFCIQKKPFQIDIQKIEDYKISLIKKSIELNISPSIKDPLNDSRTLINEEYPTEKLVSGKFIMSLIFHYIKSKYSLGNITFDSFCYRVAKNSSLDSLKPLTSNIKTHIQN